MMAILIKYVICLLFHYIAILIIHVDDENDNDPVFRQNIYKRTVMENSQPGVPIITVMADDIDKNRTIHYSLEGLNLFSQ